MTIKIMSVRGEHSSVPYNANGVLLVILMMWALGATLAVEKVMEVGRWAACTIITHCTLG